MFVPLNWRFVFTGKSFGSRSGAVSPNGGLSPPSPKTNSGESGAVSPLRSGYGADSDSSSSPRLLDNGSPSDDLPRSPVNSSTADGAKLGAISPDVIVQNNKASQAQIRTSFHSFA